MSTKPSVIRGVIMATIGAACWGFSATCAGYLMGTFGMGVTWLAFARLIIAGPIFLAVALATDRAKLTSLFKSPRMLLHMVLFALVGVVAMQVTYMTAVKLNGPGTALLLQETGLIVIMAVTCIRKHRAPTKREFVALVLALLGTAAIATQGQVGALGISPLGLLWGLLAGLAMAGHNVIPVELLEKHGSVVVNGVAMTLGAFMLLPIADPVGAFPVMPVEGWLAFAAIVAVGTLLAYVLYLQGIKEAGPVKASLVAVFEPVSGMFFGLIWLGDLISLFDLIGCVAIIAMMILVSKPE